ncbi:type II secretion system GspH family protein [Fodinisporobacter ferrooxydans]|uniref:Type II secretion system GspH family protein n=1 Tax=Fodinisporobacter ferrooxydans TaxID=2901836 RepID=A0ABY4CI16_9BACL|nr:type II secretion system GspH family protein [Alicyclobacillaceae bacterium MYW30-H2]
MIRNEKGLTLIELLVSIVILGAVLLLYINVSSSTRIAEIFSSNQNAAIDVAEQAINTIRNEALLNPNQLPTYDAKNPKFTVAVTSQPLTNTPSTAIQITKPAGLNNHAVSLETIVDLSIDNVSYSPYIVNVTVSWGPQ